MAKISVILSALGYVVFVLSSPMPIKTAGPLETGADSGEIILKGPNTVRTSNIKPTDAPDNIRAAPDRLTFNVVNSHTIAVTTVHARNEGVPGPVEGNVEPGEFI
jgi:hypothetical protein